MPENEVRSPVLKAPFALTVKILVATVIIGFGVIHFARDAMLRHPATKAVTTTSIDYGD
jgi:hypothetical protein